MIRKASAALIALLTMVGVNLVAAGPAHAASYQMMQVGVCAGPDGNRTDNGTEITIWSCTGHPLQKWHWAGMFIVHDVSGKCLTPYGNDSGTNGAVLTLWTCNFNATTGSPQRFQNEEPNPNFHIWTVNGHKCITNKGGSREKGTLLTLWTCNPEYRIEQGFSLPH
ncbi:RICIN domain-containing protein [Kitasatospora sp. NPDC002040]|uniref:RICIN domain-containing protein n=1 Tax=Kitasatospora sp. NPDC002040 TaxID=3154661 RepID=UPI003325D395